MKMNPIEFLYKEIENRGLWEKVVNLERNEFLKVPGSVDTNIYYVIKGSLRVFIVEDSEELTIRFGYKNNFIASLDSYITGRPSDLHIQALKKTEAKVVSKKKFMDFVWSSDKYLKVWIEFINQLVYQQMERERDILTASPVERYKRVLKRSPRLFQEIPHKYIASYLRMTPETLSRIKKY